MSSSPAPPSSDGSVAAGVSWLKGVGDKLGNEEFSLLKSLYLYTIPERVLEDYVTDAFQLYELPTTAAGTNEETRIGAGATAAAFLSENMTKKSGVLTSEQSLALFVHRLGVLVPSESNTRLTEHDVRYMGAKKCLEDLKKGADQQPLVDVESVISSESRLIESLVHCYVNLTSDERNAVKERLAKQAELNPERASLFDLFVRFKEQKSNQVVKVFVSCMTDARCYRAPFFILEDKLRAHNVYDGEIVKPSRDPTPEPTIDPEQERKIADNTIDKIAKNRKQQRRKRTKKAMLCCALSLIVFLDLIAFAISMTIISKKLRKVTENVNDSTYPDPLTSEIPQIYVSSFNTFWYESVTVQMTRGYGSQTVTIFILPADQLNVYTNQTVRNGMVPKQIADLYFLKGSVILFQLNITSTSDEEVGFVKISLYDSLSSLHAVMPFFNCSFFVDPGKKKQFSLNFTATWDGYYYITLVPTYASADYSIIFDVRRLNSSNWIGQKNYTLTGSDPTITVFSDRSFSAMNSAREYAVVARLSHPISDEGIDGTLQVSKTSRSLVFVHPAIAAVSGIILYFIVLAMSCVICWSWRDRRRRRRRGDGRGGRGDGAEKLIESAAAAITDSSSSSGQA